MKQSSGPHIENTKRNYESTIRRWRNQIQHDLAKYQTALSKRDQENRAIKSLEKEVSILEEVQQVVQVASEEIEKRVHKQIATVVSRCLSSVFGSNAYEFVIQFSKKRGKTEAQLLFYRDGQYVDPLTAAGGGAVDIASFALRVTCILCAVPKLRKLVILDEPFRHLAPELRPVAIQLLKELSEELEIQFIVVSHFSEEDLELIKDHGKIIRIG